jgi:hypothetical protein
VRDVPVEVARQLPRPARVLLVLAAVALGGPALLLA